MIKILEYKKGVITTAKLIFLRKKITVHSFGILEKPIIKSYYQK